MSTLWHFGTPNTEAFGNACSAVFKMKTRLLDVSSVFLLLIYFFVCFSLSGICRIAILPLISMVKIKTSF